MLNNRVSYPVNSRVLWGSGFRRFGMGSRFRGNDG
jgi:hypothetical protein